MHQRVLRAAAAPTLLLAGATASSAQTTQRFHACYVPQVGALYVIQLDGLHSRQTLERESQDRMKAQRDELRTGLAMMAIRTQTAAFVIAATTAATDQVLAAVLAVFARHAELMLNL